MVVPIAPAVKVGSVVLVLQLGDEVGLDPEQAAPVQPRLAALRLLLGLGARLFGQLGNQFRPKIMIR